MILVHPLHHTKLTPKEGKLYCSKTGEEFKNESGFTSLIYPPNMNPRDADVQQFYDDRADVYDDNLHLTFLTHNENENEVRKSCVSKLNLNESSKVLEVACGTGRDSEIISKKLGENGELILLDISPNMLEKCKDKLNDTPHTTEYLLASASYLPFPDNYFDCVYSFGGLGEFADIKKALSEMVRVTKTGGKIVVGDESIPVWLRDTYFAKVLTTTNPQFKAELPLQNIPVEARKFNLQFIIGGVFYLIDFEVGEGEPSGNFDFDIPGIRGGTLRTRYEGQLEGVTPEAKKLAYEAISTKKISMHDWLDATVKNKARKDLGIDD